MLINKTYTNRPRLLGTTTNNSTPTRKQMCNFSNWINKLNRGFWLGLIWLFISWTIFPSLGGGSFTLWRLPAAFAQASQWPELISNPVGFEGGIRNEHTYQEVVLITGQPIVVSGELKFSGGRSRGEVTTQTYSYKLENPTAGMKLTRSVTLEITEQEQNGQTFQVTGLKNFSETITIGTGRQRDTYKLVKDGYQFHHSAVIDHRPAVDYFSGNWSARKTYEINRGEGTVTLDIKGEAVGYNHHWGSTETRQIDYYLSYDRQPPVVVPGDENEEPPGPTIWNGTARLQVSFNRTKDLNYILNDPVPISFRGGYLQTEQEENILQYYYNLPYFDSAGNIIPGWRNEATENLKLWTVPRQERLPVFTMKDLRGHWAEEQISRMISVGAFSSTQAYFGPGLPITRAGFARAIVELTKMQPPADPNTTRSARQSRVTETLVSPFADVPQTHPDLAAIVEGQRRGLFTGAGQGLFLPEGWLTRAQAVTIMVRALGFEGLAPNPTYRIVAFHDDAAIPIWAKDSVYVASQLGLVSGTQGYFHPEEPLTRAEAAVLLDRFREYLQTDLKYDYRDKIINRY
ncbi:MAG: S-layer homology domain-containing protein [Syntrophomonadaceae bacterium]|nr:S-layer homology domain-containing protein [Syntrophomonadaceae bacterium]